MAAWLGTWYVAHPSQAKTSLRPLATGGRSTQHSPLPRPAQCNAEKKSLLQEETHDTEIVIVVRSSPPPRPPHAPHPTPSTFVSVQVGKSETTSQLPVSPKTAESGAVTPFAGPSKRLKLAILCAVTLQNAGYALVRRYSRGSLAL